MTVAWEIVWYQFLIELSEEAEQPVALFGEGMELEELGGHFGQGNAGLDDNGRLDASELEFELLEDPDSVISDTSPGKPPWRTPPRRIRDRQGSPEFRCRTRRQPGRPAPVWRPRPGGDPLLSGETPPLPCPPVSL